MRIWTVGFHASTDEPSLHGKEGDEHPSRRYKPHLVPTHKFDKAVRFIGPIFNYVGYITHTKHYS